MTCGAVGVSGGSFSVAWWGYAETSSVPIRLDFESLYAQLSSVPEWAAGDYWRSSPPTDTPWETADVQWPHWWVWVVDHDRWTLYRDGESIGYRDNRGVASGSCVSVTLGDSAWSEIVLFSAPLRPPQVRQTWHYAKRYVASASRDVWVCLGDSEMEGRADPVDVPVGYPPLDGSLWMLRYFEPSTYWNAWSELTEPCNRSGTFADGKGVGPAGLFGWLRSLRTSRETGVLNCAHGGRKSSEQLEGGTYWSVNTPRIDAALSTPGARLAGYVLYDGANDAVDADPAYAANWTATLGAYVARYGSAPMIVTRLPTTVPTDGAYPSWESVRTQQAELAAALGARLVDAPEGPWIEAYKLHLAIPGSLGVATRWDASLGE